MMQMMMSDPAMMQQSMAMMNQMIGGANQVVAPLVPANPTANSGVPPTLLVPTGPTPPTVPTAPAPPANPFLQMMNAMHQPSGFPPQNPMGMNPFFSIGGAVPPAAVAAQVPNLASNPVMLQAARTRFQAQLVQLS